MGGDEQGPGGASYLRFTTLFSPIYGQLAEIHEVLSRRRVVISHSEDVYRVDETVSEKISLVCCDQKKIIFFIMHYLSADLTKGSFGHFSSFYVIKILETSKISIFCMFSQESQIAFYMKHNQRRKHF